jgi:hypothetical protein
MGLPNEVFAHRILKRMPSYRDLTLGEADLPYSLDLLPSQYRAQVIGVYENQAGSLHNAVLVLRDGLFLYKDELSWYFIPYQSIRSVDYLNGKSLDVSGLVLRLKDEMVVDIPIMGGNPETGGRDAAEFMRFIFRASAQSA